MDSNENRFVFIDNLRNILVFKVVFLHALASFCYPVIFHWCAIDKEGSSRIFETLLLSLDIYLMPQLIFIAALFIFISLKDKTRLQYLKKRFIRLCVPLFVFIFCAGDIYFQILSKRLDSIDSNYSDTFVNFWSDFLNSFDLIVDGGGKMLDQIGFSHYHCWFLSFLFAMTLLILIFDSMPFNKKPKQMTEVDSKNIIINKTIVFAVLMGFAYLLVMIIYNIIGVSPGAWVSVYNLLLFRADQVWMLVFHSIFGLYVYKKEWITKGDIGSWKFWGILSAILVACYIVLMHFIFVPVIEELMRIGEHNSLFTEKMPFPAFDPPFLIAALIRSILTPMISFFLLMFFLSFAKQFLNKSNKITTFCSKHLINVYILHYIPVLILQYTFNDYAMFPLLKIILYTIIVITACLWFSYRFVYPYPKLSILFFILLKLISLRAGFEFYYWSLLCITLFSSACAIFESVKYMYLDKKTVFPTGVTIGQRNL